MSVIGIPGDGASSNAYIVGEGPAVLVDPGLPGSAEAVLDAVARSGVPVSAVMLTHRHFDHSGAAPEVASRLKVPIFAPSSEAEALRRGDALTTGALLFGGWLRPSDVRDITEAELPPGWAVIHTPGHTDGSSCLYCAGTGQLVCGDTIFCDGGVGRWDLPTGSLKELKRSVGMLASLGAAGLYPGHGRWVDAGGRLHAEMALESVRECE